MKKNIKIFSRGIKIALLFQYAYFSAFSQQIEITVSGILKDSSQKKPLTFATVTLTGDGISPAFHKTIYTNSKGEYQFKQIDSGNYLLTASYIGFKESRHRFRVDNGRDILMPVIFMAPSRDTLNAVLVSGRKPLIQQVDDKIIFNVEDDPAAKAEAAIDLFRKLPFVSVDGEDNIRLNGQANFKVLLNGRETSLFAKNIKEALKGFPGALITKIEVITSPSAKYDAEGVGGIINIITQKKIRGYNAYLNAYYNTYNFYGGSANLNLKLGKIGFSAYYVGSRGENQPGTSYTMTEPLVQSRYTNRISKGNKLSNYFWQSANAELNWDIDSLNTVVVYANMGQGNSSYLQNFRISTQLTNSLNPTLSFYSLNGEQEYPSNSIGVDFTNRFRKNSEKQFDLKFFRDYNENIYLVNSEQTDSISSRFTLNNNVDNSLQYTLQADLALPFNSRHKLELGAKTVLRNANVDFNNRIKYQSAVNYTVNPDNSDYFEYLQNVYSGYLIYSFKIIRTDFSLGARVESTAVDGKFLSSNTNIKNNYITFLPNLKLTQKFSNVYTTVLAYNKRMQRPYISSLNPFINNSDSLNIYFGNPGLEPQTVHNLSWQHRFTKGSFFGGINFLGAYSEDMIIQYSVFDKATGITKTTSANLGQSRQLSASANMNARLNKNWNLNIMGDFRHNRIQNKVLPSQVYEGFGGNASINMYYRIGKKLTLSTNGGILQLPVTVQVENGRQYWYGSGASLKMFKEKVTVSLNYSNFFDAYFDNKQTIKDLNFRTTNINTVPYKRLNASLSWNFGKLTENVSKKKGINNDDLIPVDR